MRITALLGTLGALLPIFTSAAFGQSDTTGSVSLTFQSVSLSAVGLGSLSASISTNLAAQCEITTVSVVSASQKIYADSSLLQSRVMSIAVPASLQGSGTLTLSVRATSKEGWTAYRTVTVPMPATPTAVTVTKFTVSASSRRELSIELITTGPATLQILASAANLPESIIHTNGAFATSFVAQIPLPSSLQSVSPLTIRARATSSNGMSIYSQAILVSLPALEFTLFKATALNIAELQVDVTTSGAAVVDILASGPGVQETPIYRDQSTTAAKTMRVPIPDSMRGLPELIVRARASGTARGFTYSIPATVHLSSALVGELLTSFQVKEVAGVGSTAFPTRMVVPLPRGQYQDTDRLQVVDSNNFPILSKVTPLTRHWSSDQSVRFAAVDFLATVLPFTGSGTGKTEYRLIRTTAPVTTASKGVFVTESASAIEITNSVIRLVVNKTQFRLISQAYLDANNNGIFESAEQIIDNTSGGSSFRSAWGTQYASSGRTDVKYTIEENGPVRVVVKAEAPTRFVDMMRYEPGFAVRLYVYAQSPFVKVDYQLQAGELSAVYAGPLYFDELSLDFDTKLASDKSQVTVGLLGASPWVGTLGSGVSLRQSMHNQAQLYRTGVGTPFATAQMASGYLDVSSPSGGITAFIRDFWQAWPNGIEALPGTNGTKIRLQTFPEWSSQLYNNSTLSTGGLHWLDEMMSTYKETYLLLHPPATSAATIERFAATFQNFPVAVLPYAWYQQTQGVSPFGDFLPEAISAQQTDFRMPDFSKAATAALGQAYYPFGWINYGDLEPGYRDRSCTTGGFAYGQLKWLLSGDPRDYYKARAAGIAELNTRPEWLSNYKYEPHWQLLQLSENGYCGGTWRKFIGNSTPKTAYPYLGKTQQLKMARDDQHGWFYHVEEAYYLTGDPWIRDWYRFVAEFRKTRLNQKDPFPDRSSRALGHSLAHALQAYRITGDPSLLSGVQTYLDQYLRPNQDRAFGDQSKSVEPTGGGTQTGYLARTVAEFMSELGDTDKAGYARAFAYLTGLVEWNYNYGHFPYYFNAAAGGVSASSGSAATMLDPVAWYAIKFGKRKYLDQALQYDLVGINGGERPYVDTNRWTGGFAGRLYVTAKNGPPIVPSLIPTITNVSGVRSSASITVTWPKVYGAKRYLVFHSHTPISLAPSTDHAKVNWWACDVVSVDASDFGPERAVVLTGQATPLSVTIFAMDAAGKLNDPSAVATIN